MTKGSEGPSLWPAGSVASQLTGSGSILRRRKIPWVADSGGPAPLAPRSGPRAATLFGGLRPGSLRVHDPCKDREHGSRPGFPGRRQPRGPAASGNVARGLQVLLPGEGGSASLAGSGVAPPVDLTTRTPASKGSGLLRGRKPDVACLGRNPLRALSDFGHRTLDLRADGRQLTAIFGGTGGEAGRRTRGPPGYNNRGRSRGEVGRPRARI